MGLSRLDLVASTFESVAEVLHNKFLTILADSACTGCRSAGFGEAILVARLQDEWSSFTRALVVASSLGARRKNGTPVGAIAGVNSPPDAEKSVRAASKTVAETRGPGYPTWHAPSFVIEVGTLLKINNLSQIELALGPSPVPRQITDFRNYFVHPGTGTRQKYEGLQAKLGMLSIEPEDLLHQFQSPGLRIFTSWVRELQQIADASSE